MSYELLWYTGRGTGVIALLLLTLVVVLGIVGRSGRSAGGLPRFALADVHRNASLIALGLVLVHLIVLWADPYARLRIVDLLIPFNAAYRPFWVGLGTIGFELMAVVVVTSLVRSRIGARTWKAIHWASYGMWPIAWLHGWFTGSDAGTFWFRLIAVVCLGSVVAAAAWRFSPGFLEIPRPRRQPVAPLVTRPGAVASAGPRHSADARAAQPDWRGDASWYREPTWHGQPAGPYASRPDPTGPHTGQQPAWRDQTGQQPAWREHTGQQPAWRDLPGQQPPWPGQDGAW